MKAVGHFLRVFLLFCNIIFLSSSYFFILSSSSPSHHPFPFRICPVYHKHNPPLVIDDHLLHPSPFRCNLIMELTTNKNKFPSRLPSFHIDWPEDEESTDFKKFEEKVNPLHPENNTQKSQRRSLKTATVSSPCRKCKMLCGWESVALSFAMIFLGGAHFFVFTQYPPIMEVFGYFYSWQWYAFCLSFFSSFDPC